MWRVGVPVFAAFTLPLLVDDVGSSWRAHFGSGTPGVYTAEYELCGSKSCVWRGTFVSDDGLLVRSDVGIGTGGGVDRVGQTVPAIDTGDRVSVYPPDGGLDWVWTALFLVGLLVTVGFWLRGVVRAVQDRHSSREGRSQG
jgi:hypothetical protein